MCCHRMTLPPLAGLKNGTLKTRARNSTPTPPASAGVATSIMDEVARTAHTNSGRRVRRRPRQRMLTMVTRKLIAESVLEAPRMMMDRHQKVWPTGPCSETGGYEVHPACGAP